MRASAWVVAPLLLASAAQAATLHVCPDGSGDYPTIQAAADAASSGDTIELCAGIFAGPGNRDLAFGSKNLILRSLAGSEFTTVDCHEQGPEDPVPHFGIQVDAGGELTVDGVSIEGVWWNSDGGAIKCEGGTVRLARTCLRNNNLAYHLRLNGAGVHLVFGTLVAEDCQFLVNRCGGYGGAIYAEQSEVTLSRCSFEACGSCLGGAVLMNRGTIADCAFVDLRANLCDNDPGGLAVVVRGDGDVTIRRSHFALNHDLGGAGVHQYSANGQVLIEDCSFEDCTSESGAVVSLGTGIIRRTFFRRNSAVWGPADLAAGNVLIEDCLFERGGTPYGGRARSSVGAYGVTVITGTTFATTEANATITVYGSGNVTLERSILAFATQADPPIECVPGAMLTVTCTDIFGNAGGDWVGCVAGLDGTAGNISADPLFCAPGAGDYTLRPGSPCAPANSACGQIGAYGVGCGTTAVQPTSWGQIKGMYR